MQPADQPGPARKPAPLLATGGLLGAGLVASAHFANDAVTSMLPALLPSFATRLELRPTELALLAGSFTVSTALPQP